jgi:hypothetical protein
LEAWTRGRDHFYNPLTFVIPGSDKIAEALNTVIEANNPKGDVHLTVSGYEAPGTVRARKILTTDSGRGALTGTP